MLNIPALKKYGDTRPDLRVKVPNRSTSARERGEGRWLEVVVPKVTI